LFTWRIYSYERFAYDSVGHVSTRIWFYPALSRSTVRLTNYQYDEKGMAIPSESIIKIERFWE
jgi:hypothetical protein